LRSWRAIKSRSVDSVCTTAGCDEVDLVLQQRTTSLIVAIVVGDNTPCVPTSTAETVTFNDLSNSRVACHIREASAENHTRIIFRRTSSSLLENLIGELSVYTGGTEGRNGEKVSNGLVKHVLSLVKKFLCLLS